MLEWSGSLYIYNPRICDWHQWHAKNRTKNLPLENTILIPRYWDTRNIKAWPFSVGLCLFFRYHPLLSLSSYSFAIILFILHFRRQKPAYWFHFFLLPSFFSTIPLSYSYSRQETTFSSIYQNGPSIFCHSLRSYGGICPCTSPDTEWRDLLCHCQ